MGKAVCVGCGQGFPEAKLKETHPGNGKWLCPSCYGKATAAPAEKKAQVAVREAMDETKKEAVGGG